MGGAAVTAAASNVSPTTGAPILRRVLTGEMAMRFGALPIVPLPQDDEPLLGWVRDVADILKDKGIYRRDKVVVLPYEEERRLEVMDARAFCSWIQRHLMGAKIKYDENEVPYEVCKDVPTEVAEKTLLSYDFFPSVPRIEEVLPAPMPCLDADGNLHLTPVGFHEVSGTYTFDLD
jgi:hypothetical protein